MVTNKVGTYASNMLKLSKECHEEIRKIIEEEKNDRWNFAQRNLATLKQEESDNVPDSRGAAQLTRKQAIQFWGLVVEELEKEA